MTCVRPRPWRPQAVPWKRVSASLPGLFLALCFSAPAFAGWPEHPTRDQVVAFAHGVDSVVVWSLSLPDSATAGKRFGIEVLTVAGPRHRVRIPRAWGREFLDALFSPGELDPRCECDLLRRAFDTTDVVMPLWQFHVGREVMWVAISFPDSCARVFLQQGPWNTIRLAENRATLLKLVQAALPTESALASDQFVSRRRRWSTDSVYVNRLPEAILKFPPSYPDLAREKGISGTVLVQALIGEQGSVEETRVAWSVPELDERAVTAVRQWKFKPAMSNDRPVRVWVLVPVKFRLH